MNKVFRFHIGSPNIEDWQNSSVYGQKEIDGISDPEGASTKREITSIPSPFARIDLFRTAFSQFSDGKVSLAGETIHHKLVSYCLDIGEILFNYDELKDKLKIISWDSLRRNDIHKIPLSERSDLEKLLASSNPKHKLYGETLKLFLDQDEEAYNFDLMKRIFLIEYKYRIIGGTSPATLFFTSANDLSFVDIRFGDHAVFRGDYTPLYQRDNDYQKLLHHFFKAHPILKKRMKAFDMYIERNLKELEEYNPVLFKEINELTGEKFYETYIESDTGNPNDRIDIIGCVFGKKNMQNTINQIRESDFAIKSSKYNGVNKPLVLVSNFTKPLKYTTAIWDSKIQVPHYDLLPLEKRILPGLTTQYPYLTPNDFLEPYLIRLLYPLNKECYFNGNFKMEGGNPEMEKGVLLPLTKTFFDYFNTEDLYKSMTDGKKMFEIVQTSSESVKVILRIPIQKNNEYITFERFYFFGSDDTIKKVEITDKDGVILENQFNIVLFSNIRIPSTIPFSYRVQLIDGEKYGIFEDNQYFLDFYLSSAPKPISSKIRKRSDKRRKDLVSTYHYILQEQFDYIQVRHLYASGIIIPKWKIYQGGSEAFTFAIDFGTTNTHIEYKTNFQLTPKPFEIKLDELQLAPLHDINKTKIDFFGTGAIELIDYILQEVAPFEINKNSIFKFPQRTVIKEAANLNFNEETHALADFNIPFEYHKMGIKSENTTSNLKWLDANNHSKRRIKAFLEVLILMIRNKVLLNDGDLDKTQILWFYPSSMKPGRIENLENIWRDIVKTHISKNIEPKGIVESLAPFYYYIRANTIGPNRTVISIDIGGGTTDVTIFKNAKPLLVTSFKFAGSAVTGSGLNSDQGSLGKNKMIEKYLGKIIELLLNNNDLAKLASVGRQLQSPQEKPEEIINYLFSVESHPSATGKEMYSFNAMLNKDENLKIVFLYFYSALLYHIAKIVKKKKIELPGNILFSGTASKLLNIISTKTDTLTKLSTIIFETVCEAKFDSSAKTFSVIIEKEQPKEVTCKGALLAEKSDFDVDIEKIRYVYSGTEKPEYEKIKYADLRNSDLRTALINEIKQFNSFFLSLNDTLKFSDNFNVTPQALKSVRELINLDLDDFLELGIKYNIALDDEIELNQEVEETLFFYPIIGTINRIINELSTL